MEQIRIFGDQGLPDRSGEILGIDQSATEDTIFTIDRLCEAGCDIPISYLAMLHDLWFGTMHVSIGGNYFTDSLARFASDEFDRLYAVVGSVVDFTYPLFTITQNIIKIGKYAHLIHQAEWGLI